MFMMHRTAFTPVAKFVIVVMCADDENNCRYQEPVFYLVKKLFEDQQYKAG